MVLYNIIWVSGGLPRTVLETQGPAVLSGLMAATRQETHTKAWAMSRKAAVQSALNVALTRSFVGQSSRPQPCFQQEFIYLHSMQ
jgi:hypothetical protein